MLDFYFHFCLLFAYIPLSQRDLTEQNLSQGHNLLSSGPNYNRVYWTFPYQDSCKLNFKKEENVVYAYFLKDSLLLFGILNLKWEKWNNLELRQGLYTNRCLGQMGTQNQSLEPWNFDFNVFFKIYIFLHQAPLYRL